jgi:hypothetical protein
MAVWIAGRRGGSGSGHCGKVVLMSMRRIGVLLAPSERSSKDESVLEDVELAGSKISIASAEN